MPRLSVLLLPLLLLLLLHRGGARASGTASRSEILGEVEEMFTHAYGSYRAHALPHDELRPVSCTPRCRECDLSEDRGPLDGALGNYSLTLVDALPTLAVLGRREEFITAIGDVARYVSFDRDVDVNVFEVTIRMLGGLLSSHALAVDASLGLTPPGYDGHLLRLAEDLGKRLVPAFDTKTGIPFGTINLRKGVKSGETPITCTAGGGTLLLEFGTLSRMTGNGLYERLARRALEALWERRSVKTGLLGNGINVQSGAWQNAEAGIGAGIDSVYEYMLKAYILFGDVSYLDMFNEAYRAVMEHSKRGHWYRFVNMNSGRLSRQWVDALAAFWPGMQVLAGDVEEAVRSHQAFWGIWRRFGLMVEGFNVEDRGVLVNNPGYPLRPELVESTFMLWEATRDPYFRRVGREMMQSINARCRTRCGFAAVHDVLKRTHEDRMDSYFLSETMKYLYLLFAPDDHFVLRGNWIFTTEGHILPVTALPSHLADGAGSDGALWQPESYDNQCLVVPPIHHIYDGHEFPKYEAAVGLGPGIPAAISGPRDVCMEPNALRPDRASEEQAEASSAAQRAKYEVVTSLPEGATLHVIEPHSPDTPQIIRGGDVDGLRFLVREVKDGMVVLQVNGMDAKDRILEIHGWPIPEETLARMEEDRERQAPTLQCYVPATATVRVLGGDRGRRVRTKKAPTEMFSLLASFGPALPLGGLTSAITVAKPVHGCVEPLNGDDVRGKIVVVQRGQCLFLDKLDRLEEAGAAAVIVVNTQDGVFSMGGRGVPGEEGTEMGVGIPAVMVTEQDGADLIEQHENYLVRAARQPGKPSAALQKTAAVPVTVRLSAGTRVDLVPSWFSFEDHIDALGHLENVKLTVSNKVVRNIDIVFETDDDPAWPLCPLIGDDDVMIAADVDVKEDL